MLSIQNGKEVLKVVKGYVFDLLMRHSLLL